MRAGVSRRYHRKLPRVMARIAARWGTESNGERAVSADLPSETTAAIARAASANAGAPGAQGVLAKALAYQIGTGGSGKVAGIDRPTTGSLQLAQGKSAGAALNEQRIAWKFHDRAGNSGLG